jgi:hypothetical protein
MFSNSSNIIIQNGSFTNVQGRGLNGKLVNHYHTITSKLIVLRFRIGDFATTCVS